MSQLHLRLKYEWNFIEFWVVRKFVRFGEETELPIETNLSKDIMDFLRCKVCFFGVPDYDWYHTATALNKLSVLKAIPSWGYGMERVNELLFIACKSETHNNLDIVKYLVAQGADVEAEDDNNHTPLHKACKGGNLDVVKYLVDVQRANVNAKDKYNKTPLHNACYCRNGRRFGLGLEGLDVVKYLVKHGADVKAKDHYNNTPLHYACRNGNLDMVNYLIEQGADVEAKDNDNDTLLHYACYNGNLELVKYLVVEQGADMNAKDNRNNTPLYRACQSENPNLVKYLVEKGADVKAIKEIKTSWNDDIKEYLQSIM
jgi:ankyrin repeat protein